MCGRSEARETGNKRLDLLLVVLVYMFSFFLKPIMKLSILLTNKITASIASFASVHESGVEVGWIELEETFPYMYI